MQGSGVDSSLNDAGRAQAKAFFDAYQSVPFSRIYTSALKRSQESVKHFEERGGVIEPHSALNEISWGSKEGQRITPQEDAYYRWILNQWQLGNTHLPIEGGESPDAVAHRQESFLRLLQTRREDKNVLVCMHGRAMRILLCQLLNYPIRSMDMFEHENLCLYLLHFNGSHYSVELYNQTDHLSDLKTVHPRSVIVPK